MEKTILEKSSDCITNQKLPPASFGNKYSAMKDKNIDRYKLVIRNSPKLESPDTKSPFSVGNGNFAFTADVTGLQTFLKEYHYFPLCTMSQWGWHSFPVNRDYSGLGLTRYNTADRIAEYASDDQGQEQLFKDLRENPHRLNLGCIGLDFGNNGPGPHLSDLQFISQKLDMWSGLLHSEFTVFDKAVSVITCADPETDAVSACIKSSLLASGMLGISIEFPYGSPEKNASNWERGDAHSSKIILSEPGRAVFSRILDNDMYFVDLVFSHGATISRTGRHKFIIKSVNSGDGIFFTCRFSPQKPQLPPFDFANTRLRAIKHWEDFWTCSGAIQLVNSSDKRAAELERRIVQSQYLTAIQCSGSLPPAETGLTCNSWYGKFHLEMHYWHAAHFALWGRPQLLERSLGWYSEILPKAREKAVKQGYKGVRWPKMTDPSGIDSPSSIGVFLVWQQPHPIMFAELCYRIHPCKDTLERYKGLVLESADFMSSFVHYDAGKDEYIMAPPLIPAQETHAADRCINPAFELEYFRWGLKTANKWLERLGKPPNGIYAEVASKLSPLPTGDGFYLSCESCPDTFTKAPYFYDHPSMLAALGVLPGESVDRDIMKNTLEKVMKHWDFDTMWGWDFPMAAMCCAKLGLASLAVDMLMMEHPKNFFSTNGHNPQATRDDLPLYLPGNGALLLATAMMAGGWDGDGGKHAPGFPNDGSWTVETEGIFNYI